MKILKKCFYLFLSILSFVSFFFFRKRIDGSAPRKILIVKLEYLGDALLATPAIRALKEKFPQAKISAIIGSWAKEVLQGNPFIDEIIFFDLWRYDRKGEKSFFRICKELFLLRKKLRQKKFDLAICLNERLSPLLITYLSGAKRQLGYDWQGRGFLLTNKVPYPEKRVWEIDLWLDLIKTISVKTKEKKPIFVGNADLCSLQKDVDQNSLKNENLRSLQIPTNLPIVIIHSGGPWPPKRWPKERFAEISDFLNEKYRAKVIFIGSKEERELIQEIEKLTKKFFLDLVGKLNLKQLAALIKKANLFIGNDSFPAHLAGCLEIPSIVFFGPADHIRWRPYGEKTIILRKDLPCSPCLPNLSAKKCQKGHSCCLGLELISVDEVKTLISSSLKISNDQT